MHDTKSKDGHNPAHPSILAEIEQQRKELLNCSPPLATSLPSNPKNPQGSLTTLITHFLAISRTRRILGEPYHAYHALFSHFPNPKNPQGSLTTLITHFLAISRTRRILRGANYHAYHALFSNFPNPASGRNDNSFAKQDLSSRNLDFNLTCHPDRSEPGFPATLHWREPRVRLSAKKGA